MEFPGQFRAELLGHCEAVGFDLRFACLNQNIVSAGIYDAAQ